MSRNSLKWLPAIVVPAVVITGIVALPLQAGAAVDLPDKSAKDVLLMVADSDVTAFSGEVEKTANLGLPSMDVSAGLSPGMVDQMSEQVPEGMEDFVPGAAATGAMAAALELFSGSHTARVYVDGPDKVRVQVQDSLAERNIVSNGTDAWLYDSESNTATHAEIPAELTADIEEKIAAAQVLAPADLSTPSQIADRFLSEIDPSTTVSVGTDGVVAGRSAYELILTPKTTETLVESVSIAVDSETGLPLGVTVRAVGQEDPAFRAAFTEIDLSAPASTLFDFTPPAGATVDELAVPEMTDGQKPELTPEQQAEVDALRAAPPVVTGEAWSTVVELPADTIPAELRENELLAELTTEVDGGRVLSTSLVNVLLATDGRVFAGSVPVAQLQAAASAQ
ncbi:LolA family protein [Marisediminicola senii]|uniref:LolA family protein n=1 Tax=Marisediminicola senii TaxID=2711233 RepID=UPI0013ED970D|nr:DUF2092 domain-containing protein [Marisediminicola senii]